MSLRSDQNYGSFENYAEEDKRDDGDYPKGDNFYQPTALSKKKFGLCVICCGILSVAFNKLGQFSGARTVSDVLAANVVTSDPSPNPSESLISEVPTRNPISKFPTGKPSKHPTSKAPTKNPISKSPTDKPTNTQSKYPTSEAPTRNPISKFPTVKPSKHPTSKAPTRNPISKSPTEKPANSYSDSDSSSSSSSSSSSDSDDTPSKHPTSKAPTRNPSNRPTDMRSMRSAPLGCNLKTKNCCYDGKTVTIPDDAVVIDESNNLPDMPYFPGDGYWARDFYMNWYQYDLTREQRQRFHRDEAKFVIVRSGAYFQTRGDTIVFGEAGSIVHTYNFQTNKIVMYGDGSFFCSVMGCPDKLIYAETMSCV